MRQLFTKCNFITSKLILYFFTGLFAFCSLSVQAASTTITYSVTQTNDDAEEQGSGVPGTAGTMYRTSTDLELVYDGNTRQVVGLRFQNIPIIQGATTITNAYLQFTVDENDSGTTRVAIYGEDEDDTVEFGSSNGDITGRTQTSASVNWNNIPTWSGAGTAGTDQQSPDISSIISEIVQRPGWTATNSIVIIIEPRPGCSSSACQRTAESFDGSAAPQLVITLDDSEINSTPSSLIAEWRLEESSWDGTAGEVVDETGNYNGTAQNGAQTADTSPAIAADPGTCGYGSFDDAGGGNGDYIEIPGFPDQTTDFTITAWIRTNDNTRGGQRIFADDENNTGGYALSLGDPGTGRLRFYSRGAALEVIDTPTVSAITNDTWYFVAGTADITGSQIRIYIYNTSGTLVDSVVGAITGAWTSDAGVASIGGETNSGETTNRFFGNVDEVRFYGSALTQAQIEVVLNETHDCPSLANIIVSTLNNSTLGGQAIDQDEAVQYDGITGTLFLDQSTFSNNANTYGLHAIDDGSGNILIATVADETIDGVTFGDDDIVRVSPTGTAGIYDSTVIVFDGGTHFAAADEEIDAVYQKKSDGNIILSTRDSARLPQCGGGNLNFQDDDLVEWDTGSNCATMFLDESATSNLIPNAGGDEDINGVHLLNDDPNLILFTLLRNNTIRGTAVLDGDVILYNVSGDTASIYFAESEFSSGNEDVSAITISPSVTTTTVDHYAISYPLGIPGVTCEAQTVRITAHDSSDVAMSPGSSTTITLSTSPAADSWVLKSGGGSFTGPDQYTFDSSETYVDLYLTETTATTAPHIDIDVTDGTATDQDGVSEDDNIEFSDAVFRFFAGGVGGRIGIQTAEKESDNAPGNQTIRLRSDVTNTSTMVCESRILNIQTIEMAYKCNNPTTCQAAPRVQIENAAVSTFDITPGNDNADTVDASNGNFDNVDLDFGATGTATFSFDFSDAGQIQLYARKTIAASAPDPAYTLFGASNLFVVRPFGFDIDSAGLRAADWADNGVLDDSTGTNVSWAQDASGTVFTKAGNSTNNFPLTIRSVVWESADDSDNDGVPDAGSDVTDNSTTPNFGLETSTELVDVSHTLVRPTTPGGTGTLYQGADLDFSGSGGSITTNLAFDEVGIIDLTASLDSTDYLSGGSDVTTSHEDFGRFTPDSLTVTANTPAFSNTCVAGSFSYQDEQFFYGTAPVLTITAVNEAGSTTLNYGDESPSNAAERFWKLPAVLARTYVDQAGAAASGSGSDLATVSLSGDLNYDGSADLVVANTAMDRDSFLYMRVSEESPFAASMDVSFPVQTAPSRSLIDTDDVCFDGDGDGSCETDGSDDYDNFTIAGAGSPLTGTTLRFGRVNIGTAVGSELLALNPPFIAEYYDGTGFVTNSSDTCSTLDLIDHVRLDNTGTLVAGNALMTISGGSTSISTFNSPLAAGDTGTEFSAPGAGNTGYVNIFGNLDCSDLTVLCAGTATFNHLLYDWEGDGGFDENPAGRIDFGIFKGPNEFIYIREPWN